MMSRESVRARFVSFSGSSHSWVGRVATLAVLLIGAFVGLVLIIPALLIGTAVLLLVIAWARARQWLSRFIGDTAGRRNVRPIPPR